MALECFGIIGKINDPLFLKDFSVESLTDQQENDGAAKESKEADEDQNDFFGFKAQKTSLSMQHEVNRSHTHTQI